MRRVPTVAVDSRAGVFCAALSATYDAQTPQPFPRAGQPAQTQRPPAAPAAPAPAPAAPQSPAPAIAAAARRAGHSGRCADSRDARLPDLSRMPSSSRRTTPAAGSATTSSAPPRRYADVVLFYRTQLDERGDVVFKEPPTHMFNVGRFRDETMAFPPGVTVKDWTWGGSQGYPNTKLGAEPARFPTVVMIVPPPPARHATGALIRRLGPATDDGPAVLDAHRRFRPGPPRRVLRRPRRTCWPPRP